MRIFLLNRCLSSIAILLIGLNASAKDAPMAIYLRANQLGYLPQETKTALVFSRQPLDKLKIEIVDAKSGKKAWGLPPWARILAPVASSPTTI